MLSAPQAKALARLMSEITEAVLWQPWQRALGPRKAASLNCRAGHGRATYHRYNPAAGRHDIVYGAKMVADKASPADCAGWLSTREIRRRGYWQGEVSMLNLLAHTCCHEFAHLQQSMTGGRERGRVHTPGFYRLLDNLHASGAADEVRDALYECARSRQLIINPEPYQLAEAGPDLSAFSPGDPVVFGHQPHTRTGRIVRVNRRTCTVAGTGAASGLRFRVPATLLWHPEDAGGSTA